MKPIAVILCSGLFSAAVALGTSYFLMENSDPNSALTDSNESSAVLSRAVQKLDELDRRQSDFEKRFAQAVASPDTTGIMKLNSDFQREIASLRSSFASLEKQMAERPVASPDATRKALARLGEIEDEEAAVALAEFVDAKVQEKVRESQRKQFTPMIRAGIAQRTRRTMAKLDLNEDQQRRFEEASNAALEKNMPFIEVMMDRSASPEERAEAFEAIDSSIDDVARDAESYLTPEQHNQLLEEQQKQQAEMERFRMMFSGGANPPTNPPTGSSRTTGN